MVNGRGHILVFSFRLHVKKPDAHDLDRFGSVAVVRIRFFLSENKQGMWLGYWSIAHLPSLLLVLNVILYCPVLRDLDATSGECFLWTNKMQPADLSQYLHNFL
ncbi:hypothetical protein ACJX0J_008229, partial [Zea mays]